ncbi:MAG: hypothetical protein EHM64_14480 [Ignavibacteriae bacterium]|nr:MAG: hypothetical protein EHM64_14480 [Ignavibacteriota bacterium]
MKSSIYGYQKLAAFVILSASLLFISCSKDETTVGPNSSSNNNGSNSDAGSAYFTFKVDGVAMDFLQYNPTGFYYATNGGTYISGREGGFTYPDFDLGFPGKTTGTFTESSGGWVNYTDANNVDYYYEPSTCTITVTKYGAVGDYIVGTFSATKNSSTNTVSITEGRFSVIRTY